MSYEAWGTPPEPEPKYCPLCDQESHSPDCELGKMQARAFLAEGQRDDLQAWRWRNELNARIGAAVQRAGGELPEGYDLHIEIERGAASVRLYLADTDASIDEFGGDDLADYLHNAINIAIEDAEK